MKAFLDKIIKLLKYSLNKDIIIILLITSNIFIVGLFIQQKRVYNLNKQAYDVEFRAMNKFYFSELSRLNDAWTEVFNRTINAIGGSNGHI